MPVLSRRLAAVVLAAGGGSRLGGGKLLLPWRGKPILIHVVAAALELQSAHPLVVVTGHESERARRALASEFAGTNPPLRILDNRDWKSGQSASLRLGLAEAAGFPDFADVRGVMVLLGDQPRVRPSTLRRLAEEHVAACGRDPSHPATVPAYAGRRGNPVVLSPCLFAEISAVRGDVGARDVLARRGKAVLSVAVDDPGVLADVDTPDDYVSLPPGDA